MRFSHAEILESMIEDVEYLVNNCAAKVQPTFPDNWQIRKTPLRDIYHVESKQQLELIKEANRLLAA